MTRNEINYLIDSNLEQVTVMLMDDFHWTLQEALDKVYLSQWYEKICDTGTGLYFQSPNYNYLLLKEEMMCGRFVG